MTRSTFVLTNLLASVFVLFALSPPVRAAVFCVADATDLQAALTTAASNGEDDQIQIVQGTYVGNFVYASTQANDLAVQGGWTAGCTSREIDPTNTVLDGNQTGTVLVLSAPDVTADLLLHGVTLRNGLQSGSGGGLRVQAGRPSMVTVASNIVQDNHASYNGGGVFVSGYSGVAITNNTIQGNSASSGGGGVHVYSVLASNIIAFTNNTIHGNIASYSGGGVYVNSFSNTVIAFINNSIQGNNVSQGNGGGAYIYSESSNHTNTFINNSIQGNSASQRGGGFGLRLYKNSNSANFYNNLFWDNTSRLTTDAGADLWIDNDGNGDYILCPVTLLHNNFDPTPGSGVYFQRPIPIDPSNLDKVDPLWLSHV